MLMENEIRDILRDILRRGDNILGTMPATDPNCMFLHTLVNYARAKQESEGALARIRDAISIEKDKPRNQVDELEIGARFVNLSHKRFNINPQRAKALFDVLQEAAE
jgi:hypothetical protein